MQKVNEQFSLSEGLRIHKMPKSYIFDTNVFNRLADGKIQLSDISDGILFATHVQLDELRATEGVRREQLLATFKQVGPTLIPTETFCWDVSGFDNARWSDGQLFNSLKACLNAKEKKSGRKANRKKVNSAQDALIAEVAIVQNLTLVTADIDLADAAREHGASVQLIA